MKIGSAVGVGQLVNLHSEDWLARQRIAGKVAAKTLSELERLVSVKSNLTTRELSEVAESVIFDHGCEPTFKGYKGHGSVPFPAAVCISVNRQVVHGVPTDYRLQEGDLVSFDLGATYQGAVADSAITCCFGEYKSKQHQDLVVGTRQALLSGIQAVVVGKRLGSIGHAVYKKAQEYNISVITQYGGHGISETHDRKPMPHATPFVANKAEPNEGIVMQKGLVIAIEPQCCIGSPKTRVGADKWTVETEGVSAHFEHSVFLHENTVEIITLRENEDKKPIA